MQAKNYDITQLATNIIQSSQKSYQWRFIWGHGWGQDKHAFDNIAQSLSYLGLHVLLDFPGFGASPKPNTAWTTTDYADLVALYLKENPYAGSTVWIGHSFGGRVGIQLCSRHPDLVDKLILIAAAGIPLQRSLIQWIHVKSKIYTFKVLKKLVPMTGMNIDELRRRFGSSDYKNAGGMREIFTNVIREDLSNVAKEIICPTCLIYGEEDIDTPPGIGERLAKLIVNAEMNLLSGQDHHSLLREGRHQVSKRIRDFLIHNERVE